VEGDEKCGASHWRHLLSIGKHKWIQVQNSSRRTCTIVSIRTGRALPLLLLIAKLKQLRHGSNVGTIEVLQLGFTIAECEIHPAARMCLDSTALEQWSTKNASDFQIVCANSFLKVAGYYLSEYLRDLNDIPK
jgi:hypothetical protein